MADDVTGSDLGKRYIFATELHDQDEIRRVFEEGLDPNEPIEGNTPVEWMIEMYLRSPRFSSCLEIVLDAGARLDDDALRLVLLDDGAGLARLLADDPAQLERTLSLCTTYVLIEDASLLHIAAEFGNVAATRALIEAGADLEATAATDTHGVGGQTPIFHAIASNLNHCAPVMEILLDAGARADVRLAALRWGVGFPWETTLYDVTPVSYAQAGLLPQFHRSAERTYDAIERLLAAAGRPVPPRVNVPNAYVGGKTT